MAMSYQSTAMGQEPTSMSQAHGSKLIAHSPLRLQRPLQILDEIAHILDAHAQAQQGIGDA